MRRLALILALFAWALLARGAALPVALDPALTDDAGYAQPVRGKVESVARSAGVHLTVAPAPQAERLPAVPHAPLGGVQQRLADARFEKAVLSEARAGHAVLRVRRHVPRMDSGDPPRV